MSVAFVQRTPSLGPAHYPGAASRRALCKGGGWSTQRAERSLSRAVRQTAVASDEQQAARQESVRDRRQEKREIFLFLRTIFRSLPTTPLSHLTRTNMLPATLRLPSPQPPLRQRIVCPSWRLTSGGLGASGLSSPTSRHAILPADQQSSVQSSLERRRPRRRLGAGPCGRLSLPRQPYMPRFRAGPTQAELRAWMADHPGLFEPGSIPTQKALLVEGQHALGNAIRSHGAPRRNPHTYRSGWPLQSVWDAAEWRSLRQQCQGERGIVPRGRRRR